MSGNIANGGLVAKWRDTVIFAQPGEWFLNTDDEFIYYSNRNDKNRLYRKRSVKDPGAPIVKEPCSFVTLFGDGLYYINEEQMKVYRCSTEGKGRALCSGESATEFSILPDGAVYVNPGAKRLCVYGKTAYYADVNNHFALTVTSLQGAEPKAYPDIVPSSINVHDGSIYYADRMRENALYRLDPAGARLSIFGAGAEHLHIIDHWLYFINGRKWRRLSLLNFGEAEEV